VVEAGWLACSPPARDQEDGDVRLFVAVFPPEDHLAGLRREVGGALARAGKKVRLTPVERWHITLAFLGEVGPERLPEVAGALSGVRTPGPISLRMSGGGSFGRSRSAALWAGIDGDLAALGDLRARIRSALVAGDLPHDDRPFTPHLTVAYASSAEVREALADYAGPTWTADEFVLVHSRHAEGAGYETLGAWPLAERLTVTRWSQRREPELWRW
jgi:2'-5' RNA ligase